MKTNSNTLTGGNRKLRVATIAVTLTLSGLVAGCTSGPSQTLALGYQVNQESLDLVPEGSSREQVLLSLGSPSTTTQINGSETYYYISQIKKRSAAFMRAKLVDQKVLAVYFGKDDTVSQIANYGLKDGKVFDFISRTTPTGGKDITFIGQILGSVSNPGNPLGTGRPSQ